MSDNRSQALPQGYRFNEFEIEQVIGEGGFGIVYSAWDHQLERRVAIKEYMPASMAVRGENLHLQLRSERFVAVFQAGMNSFIQEARILARFSHPGLLHVLRFWQDNDTAYMVTEFYSGDTLKNRYQKDPQLVNETWIRSLLPPLLSALRTLHDNGYLHRDIALDNIQIQENMLPVLLDFGSACKEIGHLTDKTEIMLKPGYAPIEQYSEGRDGDQGPWTDIYALGAVLHMLVAGEPPPVSVVRLISNNYQPLAQRQPPGFSLSLLQLIDEMLQLQPEDRPQSIQALAARLISLDRDIAGRETASVPEAIPTPTASFPATLPVAASPDTLLPVPAVPAVPAVPDAAQSVSVQPGRKSAARRPLILAAAAAAGLAAVVVWLVARPAPSEPAVAAVATPASPAATPPPRPAPASSLAAASAPSSTPAPAPLPAPAAKPPVAQARVYLNLQKDDALFLDGEAQPAATADEPRLLRLAPGHYQLAVKRGEQNWTQQLEITQAGTWLVKVPERFTP
ncbi:serine/threonine protein kinase [Pantoea piersonii]|uniref:serine/threonine protein kinase n=1 Tax=Pantoea piersonii TaxID=2364647 RepID=UPI0022F179E3|nr:serine/threonine-protein kinase [Pantoea piersonii]WBV24200.1 serine/threonine-protein kinase [Pantoea piersonii]